LLAEKLNVGYHSRFARLLVVHYSIL